MKKISLLIGVLGVSLIYVSFYFLSNDRDRNSADLEKAQDILNMCNVHEKGDCLMNEINNYIYTYPQQTDSLFRGFFYVLKEQKSSETSVILLEIAHHAGMNLIGKGIPLDKAFEYCGHSFKQGCIHGAMMGFIQINHEDNTKTSELSAICKENAYDPSTYINCIHGIGHSLVSIHEKPVVEIIKECDMFKNTHEKVACASGVFMEYSKGHTNPEHGYVFPWGKEELPCDSFDRTYRKICYAMNYPTTD